MPDLRADVFGTYEHCGPDGSCFRPKGHEGGCVPRPQLPEGLFTATGLRGPISIPKMTVTPENPAELDVEAIRENIRLYDLDDGGDTPAQGEYTDSDLAVRDLRRLLDENARLNTENAEARRELSELTADQFANIQLHVQANTTHYEEQIRSLAEQLAARDRTVEALSARLTAKNAELDKVIREAAADKVKLAEIGEGSEEWAIQVFHRPGGSGYYFHDSTGEDPEQDLADVLELLADGRDMAGNPIEHGPVSIVKRTVWSTEWKTVEPSEMPRPPRLVPGTAAHWAAKWMPRPPAEEAQTEYRCPNCYRWALWTDGVVDGDDEGAEKFWCQTCGFQTPVEDMDSRPQEPTSGPETAGTGSGRGTGITEAQEASHVIEFDPTEGMAVDIEHPLLGDSIETEYLGETNGIHRWRLTIPAAGANSITFPSLPVPSTEGRDGH